MKEKVKNIPIIGRFIGYIYYCTVKAYKLITHKLLRQYISQYRWNKMRREILENFSDSKDKDIKELTENIRQQGAIRTFNYPFYDKYHASQIRVLYDHGYPYVEHQVGGQRSRRMYFPIEWKENRIAKSYCQLLVEQDKDSPHCYKNEEYRVKDDAIVLDLGGGGKVILA